MTGDVAIVDRFDVTWSGATELLAADPDRVDRLCARLADHHLAEALEDAGVRVDGEVCLRRVAVPVHAVRWDDQDDTILAGWGRSIAGAVAEALRSRLGHELIVRYPSRLHAIIDAAVGAHGGDRSRAWAWQQLGIWDDPGGPSDAASWLVGHLRTSPDGVVPALAALARAGWLGAFIAGAGLDAIASLVRAAWVHAGGDAAALPGSPSGPLVGGSDWWLAAAGVVDRSEVARATAVLARPPVTSMMGEQEGSRNPIGGGGGGDVPPVEPSDDRAGAEPGSPVQGTEVDIMLRSLAAAAVLEAEPSLAATAGARAVVEAVARATAAPGPPASGAAHPAPRQPSPSEWGGLVFLLGVVAEIDLPARVPGDPVLGSAGLRATLHLLSGELLRRAAPAAPPPAGDDPARLAFAGLSPHDPPPDPFRSGISGLASAVGAEADRVVAGLRARLAADDLAGEDEAGLLRAVCRRSAVIEADPGWIDVSFDLDQVVVAVRRAGLDIDPGYLPWLGCVVRFRYG